MKSKKMKVLYSTRSKPSSNPYTGSSYIETPKISMEGKWLEALGFHIGEAIQVEYEEGSIHISPLVCEASTPYAGTSKSTSKK